MRLYRFTNRADRIMPQPATSTFATAWRSFRAAAWLGWQIESNWTDPILFAIYSLLKPLSGAAILIVIYGLISQSGFDSPSFAYLYLGNALYMYVGGVLIGVSWAVIEERERYKMLKYIYVAPIRFSAYLLGHSVARIATTTFSVIVTLLFGVLVLGIRLDPVVANWPLFAISFLLGVVMLAMMGLVLAGVMLLIVHHGGHIGEGVAGALYLFSGAIFPIDTLPEVLRPFAYAMPLTYWLELTRRSLMPTTASVSPLMMRFSDLELLGILIGMTLLLLLVGGVIFGWCERRARDRGMLDRVTNY